MRTTNWLTGALAMMFVAAPLMAQESPEQRIQAAMARAQAQGLPVALLESKLAEGKAKGVDMERIAAALQARTQAMERAQQALQRAEQVRARVHGTNPAQPSAQDIAVGADAIGAGVSEAVLAEIAADIQGGERRTVAMAALAYLVEEGHLPEVARTRVMQALGRGGPGMADLRGMAGGHGMGGPPAGVPAGRPAGAGRRGGRPGG